MYRTVPKWSNRTVHISNAVDAILEKIQEVLLESLNDIKLHS